MSTNDIRLIAMDMDGTLLNEEQRLSQENIKALQDAVKAGVHIAICSGRMAGDGSLFALDAGLPSCHILALNGAYCLEKPLGQAYANRMIAPDALEACLTVLSEYDVTYACFEPEGVIIIESTETLSPKAWGIHRDRVGAPVYQHGQVALQKAVAKGLCKVVCVDGRSPKRLTEIREKLLPIQGLDVTSSWGNNLELMPAGVNKGAAVRELAERLGISAAQVMVIGDYDNDLSMLEYAGWGIAMGNATEAVKQAARHVTLSNREDGVAQAIRRYAL